MDNGDIYRKLEEAFAATFVNELIPGILHNFANPLNGIMGRAKILRRRIEENIKKMEEKYPEAAAGMIDEIKRVRADINSISQESDAFYNIFKDATAKFNALAAKEDDNINITQLIDTEMRFANFNLNFKHEVKKEIRLDSDIPAFKGNIAELSLAFWVLIRFAMARARATKLKEFSIITGHDNKYVNVVIKNSGVVLPDTTFDALMDCVNNGLQELADDNIDQGVLNAFLILNKYDARINMFTEDNFNTISIDLPYSNKRTEKNDI